MYEIALPTTGWWVVLEHPDSIAAAEAALAVELASVGVGELDVAVLRGANRDGFRVDRRLVDLMTSARTPG